MRSFIGGVGRKLLRMVELKTEADWEAFGEGVASGQEKAEPVDWDEW